MNQPKTRRKRTDDIETGGSFQPREEVGREPADCPDGVRRIGGVNLAWAQAWNVGTRPPISTDLLIGESENPERQKPRGGE